MPKSKYKRKSSRPSIGKKRKKPGASYAKSSNPRGKRM